LAGVVNIAGETKCQIAGVVNITQKGRFQAGLINVRDTADGISLGLINIVKQGGVMEAGIEAGEFVHTALTFRSGVQRLYSIISVGWRYPNNKSANKSFFAIGTGLGTSFKLIGNLGLNLELTHTQFYKRNIGIARYIGLTQFSPQLNYRFAKHFKMYVGPSLNLLVQSYDYNTALFLDPYYEDIKSPYSLYHSNFDTPSGNKNRNIDMWIGITGGIKF
jgi:opacity protein-like surface antigen